VADHSGAKEDSLWYYRV